jgi:hypothetical protein
VGEDRCVRVVEPEERLWPTASFIALLRAALPFVGVSDFIAFADQDDVWLPDKLSRGVDALAATNPSIPTLYCARLSVVNADLQPLHETRISQRDSGFPHSLTQNIATGCTVLLNRSAAVLVAQSAPPSATSHDWWSYLLVTATGGEVLVDEASVALYRQHGGNVIGMCPSEMRRAISALQRGPAAFMTLLRQHVAALLELRDSIPKPNYSVLLEIHEALHGSFRRRLRALCLPGLRRRGLLETLVFRVWFLIG